MIFPRQIGKSLMRAQAMEEAAVLGVPSDEVIAMINRELVAAISNVKDDAEVRRIIASQRRRRA